MKVLKAIGGFFAKIGRWIKNTAWIQPLLIVGGIFAIIFAINPVSTWVSSWFKSGDQISSFYGKYKLSWSDVSKEKTVKDEDGNEHTVGKSKVDSLLTYIAGYDHANEAKYKKDFGEKFFVQFMTKGCTGCESNYDGFKYLKNHWGKDEFVFEQGEKESFKFYTIYIDTKENSDDDETIFEKYCYSQTKEARYQSLFEDLATTSDSWYRINEGIDVDNFHSNIVNGVATPVVFMFDFEYQDFPYLQTYVEPANSYYHISDLLFTYEGELDESTDAAKARTLWNCWNHLEEFSVEGRKK